MSMTMNRHGYEELIAGDIAWLDTVASDAQKRAPLEYAHIKLVLEWSVKRLYDRPDGDLHLQLKPLSLAEVEQLREALEKEMYVQSGPIVKAERTCTAGLCVPYLESHGPDSMLGPADEIVYCTCLRELGSEKRIADTCRMHNDRTGLLECCCIGLPLEPPTGTKCPRHPER